MIPPGAHNQRSDVFADLTINEYSQVRDYMSRIPGLTIYTDPYTPINQDYLYLIHLTLPKKVDVLRYLDTNGPKPAREATAVVLHGSMGLMKEYVVGPLPNPTYHREVTLEKYHREIPITASSPYTAEYIAMTRLFATMVFSPLGKLLTESFGPGAERNLTFYEAMPGGVNSGDRQTWLTFCRNVEGSYIHPVGFEILLDHSNSNTSAWTVTKLFYNGQYFDTVADLQERYNAGTVKKIIYKSVPNYASLKPTQKPTGMGPQHYYAEGRRFSVKNNHVVYLDWSFAFGLNTLLGMRVFDVRFKGERIAYELSVQEAMSVYGSATPNLMLTKFLDASLGIGRFAYELVRGVDCPYSATYIDNYHYLDTDLPRTAKNSICIFEHDVGRPLRRHFSPDRTHQNYGGLVNSALVFRTISSIGNYDYIWDFIFYQSGSVEAKVHATGYIASSFDEKSSNLYGQQVAPNVIGNIHTHFLNFKVDLDVLGVKNMFQTKDMQYVNVSLPWMPERYAMVPQLVENQLHTEKDAALRYGTKTPRYLHIASNQTNRWGQQRSYRLQVVSFTGDHLPESEPEERSMSWARYKVAITKHKDTEQTSSSLYSQNDIWSPAVDFSRYIEDDENIDNEDIPNTVTVGNGGGVILRPHNYFDEDPSIHSTDGVYFNAGTVTSCDNNKMACLSEDTCSPVLDSFNFNGFT